MDAVQSANSGHPGMPMGMADVATVLFRDFLRFYPKNPNWHNRDRFVLSAGHGSMLLYSLLHLTGYDDFSLEEIKNFRQYNAKTAGHPEYGHGDGIETTTGPLGQGFANGCGMALAEQLLQNEFGAELIDHRTWVVAGDGCLMEGISHEAASLAGHLRLKKLTVLFDDNGISIDGQTTLTVSEDTLQRFSAYGWHTLRCDGHDEHDIKNALQSAVDSDKPTIIACKTTIGYGAPNKQGTAAAHGAPLGEAEITLARQQLQWDAPAFQIDDDIRQQWLSFGEKSSAEYEDWQQKVASLPGDLALSFTKRLSNQLPDGWDAALNEWQSEADGNGAGKAGKMATRQSSGEVLKRVIPNLPSLLGGSADLTGSNITHVGQPVVQINDGLLSGSYIHYGVREHAMAAMMNGIALHGGFIPYGGTFLVFSDYCRPAIRLAALMGIRVIYVMTHDSIGLGEDGPTHQPIEHLASLRAIPNLSVFRPCDTNETAHSWRMALQNNQSPSLLALSRQGLPSLSQHCDFETFARGGYVISPCQPLDDKPAVNLVGSGSEVAILIEAQTALRAEGICANVISMPCLEQFLQQDTEWQQEVLPPTLPTVFMEAASALPWQAAAHQLGITRTDFICLQTFGLSAPANKIYEHFGITADACVRQVQLLLNS